MKISFVRVLMFGVSLYLPIEGSGTLEITKATLKPAFQNALYDDAWVGATYFLSLSATKLAQVKKESGSQKKDSADKDGCDTISTRVYTWCHAVYTAEILLALRPFEQWTVADIQRIARAATTQTASHPGCYRTHALCVACTFNEDDNTGECFEKVYEGSLDQIPEDLFLLASPDQNFDEVLGRCLATCQRGLVRYRGEGNTEGIVVAAASIFFDLARYAPFECGNADIGRLLMNIILIQEGIPILRFSSFKEYGTALMASIASNVPRGFWDFVVNCHEEMCEERTAAEHEVRK